MPGNDSMDVYMVCGDKDIRLLRHFLTSYNIFFKSAGKIYLWVWRKHEYLLRSITLPKNLILLYKDDVLELTDNDFKNQMYLKLIAHRFVETDWYWVADTDYLIVSPLCKADFFYEEKPYWFYCEWQDIPERSWRSGSEAFLGGTIPLQFMDQQQYVHNKRISYEFSKNFNPEKILHEGYLAAEQVVYAAYVYEKFHDLYQWVDYADDRIPLVSYKVNQRPPSYCELNDEVKLSDLPAVKYHVFWSHWEKAEEKMVEFLVDAQTRAFGKLVVQPDDTRMFRYWPLTEIDRGCVNGIDGLYNDGWLMRDVWFRIQTDHRSVLSMELIVPCPPSGICTSLRLFINVNEHHQIRALSPGAQTLALDLDARAENRISFRFEGGFAEPHGARTLFAQIGAVELSTVAQAFGVKNINA